MSSQYPKDEFDRAGEDMPIGMHRPQPSRWRSVLPFLAILVIVPLLGWGASQLLTSQGNTSAQSEEQTTQQSAAQSGTSSPSGDQATPTESATPEPTAEPTTPTPEPSATPEETQAVDYNVAISVLNGTGVNNYAAQISQQLNAAGFPGTTAANNDGWISESSTVYYADPALAATANEIARVLGIGVVDTASDADLGSADVVVLLR